MQCMCMCTCANKQRYFVYRAAQAKNRKIVTPVPVQYISTSILNVVYRTVYRSYVSYVRSVLQYTVTLRAIDRIDSSRIIDKSAQLQHYTPTQHEVL